MKKIQVFFNYGIKNYVYQMIEWRYTIPSLHLSFYELLLKAYALNEMANIERLRNVEQQITSTVDELTNNFKENIQTILSNNQLLISNHQIIYLP